MPDNPTYVDGEGDVKYRTFEGIPSITKQASVEDGKSQTLLRFTKGSPTRKDCTRYLGLLLAFLSGVMMTTYSSLIKTLQEMDVMQVVVIRGVLQVSIMGGIKNLIK